jgi:hypothetical protein
MTINLSNISNGDLILFNHNGEVWKGVCVTRFNSSVLLEVNKSLSMDISDNEIIEVIKREV